MRYKHIVFDVDGTLIDTEKTEMEALRLALRKTMGHEKTYDEVKVVFGTTGRIGLKNLGYSPEEVDLIYPYWYQLSVDSIASGRLFPGVVELLQQLKAADCTMGVVTSRARTEYDLGAEPNGFSRFFDVAICLEDTQSHKPDAAPLLEYMKRAGAEKSETIYVGDSPFDMECARNAGIDSALALWGAQNAALPATYRAANTQELLQILLG